MAQREQRQQQILEEMYETDEEEEPQAFLLGQPTQEEEALEEPHPPTDEEQVVESDRNLLMAHSSIPGGGECYNTWIKKNKCPKTLMAFAIGLKDTNGRELADFDNDDIYKNMTGRSNFNPTVEVLRAEIKRRCEILGYKFKKKAATKTKSIEWLKTYPIKEPKDVAFILKEEKAIYSTAVAAAAEEEKARRDRQTNANWHGHAPWLRMYGAMSTDEAKVSLAHWNRTLTREELDARNSSERPETYPEVVTRLWNDPNFVYTTEVLPELHELFSEAHELRFADMPGGR